MCASARLRGPQAKGNATLPMHFFLERTAAFTVEQIAGMNALKMGRWPMTTFGTLSTLTAYLSLAFVGAIVLGLL